MNTTSSKMLPFQSLMCFRTLALDHLWAEFGRKYYTNLTASGITTIDKAVAYLATTASASTPASLDLVKQHYGALIDVDRYVAWMEALRASGVHATLMHAPFGLPASSKVLGLLVFEPSPPVSKQTHTALSTACAGIDTLEGDALVATALAMHLVALAKTIGQLNASRS